MSKIIEYLTRSNKIKMHSKKLEMVQKGLIRKGEHK